MSATAIPMQDLVAISPSPPPPPQQLSTASTQAIVIGSVLGDLTKLWDTTILAIVNKEPTSLPFDDINLSTPYSSSSQKYHTVNVHRFVLAMRTSIKTDQDIKRLATGAAINVAAFKCLVYFLYHDHVDNFCNTEWNVLTYAVTYEVAGLVKECCAYIKKTVTVENALDFYTQSHFHKFIHNTELGELITHIKAFIHDNSGKIFESLSFRTVPFAVMLSLFQQQHQQTTSTPQPAFPDLVDAIVNWKTQRNEALLFVSPDQLIPLYSALNIETLPIASLLKLHTHKFLTADLVVDIQKRQLLLASSTDSSARPKVVAGMTSEKLNSYHAMKQHCFEMPPIEPSPLPAQALSLFTHLGKHGHMENPYHNPSTLDYPGEKVRISLSTDLSLDYWKDASRLIDYSPLAVASQSIYYQGGPVIVFEFDLSSCPRWFSLHGLRFYHSVHTTRAKISSWKIEGNCFARVGVSGDTENNNQWDTLFETSTPIPCHGVCDEWTTVDIKRNGLFYNKFRIVADSAANPNTQDPAVTAGLYIRGVEFFGTLCVVKQLESSMTE